MRTDSPSSALAEYLAMVATIVAAVVVTTFVDVQISLGQIDPNDSATWPNMAPQIRYYFIPVLATFVSAISLAVNLILQLLQPRRLVRRVHWVLLGAGYSVVLLALPIARAGINGITALSASIVGALLVALWVRRRYGVLPSTAAA